MTTALSANQHIVLVGLMGSGKSSVGRRLAQQLGRRFVDTDRVVEERAHQSVRDIFETRGEAEFRLLETEVLRDAIADPEATVVAAAGGVVLSDANRELLLSNTSDGRVTVVWLDTDTSELVERVKRGAHRPLLDEDPHGTLERMSETRRAMYESVSNVVVETNGRSVEDVAHEVLRVLGVTEARND